MDTTGRPPSNKRITGFDLARAYAIFGMFIVNFNYAFGSFSDQSSMGNFLNLFVGNSSAIFIILAGMGLSFMTGNAQSSIEEKKRLRSVVLKRSWFLFASGLLLFLWWPGDILHFYGAYMHIAAFLLFIPRRYYLFIAMAAIVIYHVLLLCIPVDTGWDFSRFQPTDFWTFGGFFRNTLYNGWNPVFPWIAYFMLGLYLGRLNWSMSKTKNRVFIAGLICFTAMCILRTFAHKGWWPRDFTQYCLSEYFPPYLPFMLITAGFAMMVVPAFMLWGEYSGKNKLVQVLAATGRMTLTHYVLHVTLGMLVFQLITGIVYTGSVQNVFTASPTFILIFASVYFLASVLFSFLWSHFFKQGPLEYLLRKFSLSNRSSP